MLALDLAAPKKENSCPVRAAPERLCCIHPRLDCPCETLVVACLIWLALREAASAFLNPTLLCSAILVALLAKQAVGLEKATKMNLPVLGRPPSRVSEAETRML